jgi:hypothetical protein
LELRRTTQKGFDEEYAVVKRDVWDMESYEARD